MDQPWVSPQTVAQATQALRLLWPRDLEGRMLLASAVVDPDHPEGPVVAWGEVIGVPRLLNVLNTFYGSERIYEVVAADRRWLESFPDLAQEKWKGHNIFLFGGPVHNALTRGVFGCDDGRTETPREVQTQCFFRRRQDDTWVLSYPGNPEGVAAVPGALRSRDGERETRFPFFKKDYGLVVSCQNPWAPRRLLMLFAGVRCVGSSAAVACAVLPGIVEELAEIVQDARREGAPAEAVVEVTCWAGEGGIEQDIQMIWPRESARVRNPAIDDQLTETLYWLYSPRSIYRGPAPPRPMTPEERRWHQEHLPGG